MSQDKIIDKDSKKKPNVIEQILRSNNFSRKDLMLHQRITISLLKDSTKYCVFSSQ